MVNLRNASTIFFLSDLYIDMKRNMTSYAIKSAQNATKGPKMKLKETIQKVINAFLVGVT